MGMMGRRGMMTEEDDDDEDIPGGGMMGRMMGRGHKMGHGGKLLRHLAHLTQQLDLTDEQQIQVRSLVRPHMKKAIRARADIAVNRLDLHALLAAESVELSNVKELLQAIASEKADLHFAHITLKQEIGKLLTPEQQKKFRSMRRYMMRGDRGMMGPGGMRGRSGMMGRGGMQGQGSMKNPCGMTGSGTSKQ